MKFKLLIIIALLIIPAVFAIKTFTVKENDLVNILPKAFDPDNDSISYTFTQPINSSGQWQTSYEDSGEYLVTVTATDGQTSASEEIILSIENVNRLPLVPSARLTINEGDSVSLPLPKKDLDGDPITYKFERPFNSLGIWQTDNDDAGEYVINLEATDGEFSELAIIKILVNDINQPLVLNVPNHLEVNEGQALVFEFEAYDPDGDEVELTIDGLPESAVLEDKILTWNPNFEEIKRSGGFVSTLFNSVRLENKLLNKKRIPLSVKACNEKECKEAQTDLIVYNINRKPIIDEIPDIIIGATEELSLNITATDPDGDLLNYYFSEPLGRRNGIWKTNREDVGEHTVFVTASDGDQQTSRPVNLKVLKNNRNPKIKITPNTLLVNEGETVEISLSAEDPDQDETVFSVEELPTGASFDNDSFTWTPSYETVTEKSNNWEDELISRIAYLNREFSSDKLVKTLNFKVSDGETEVKEEVQVIVKNFNRHPEVIDFLPANDVTVKTYEPIVFHVAAKDEDKDRLTYDWSFSLHEPRVKNTDTIERTFIKPGQKKVRVIVSDGSEEIEVIWRVTAVETEVVPLKLEKIEEKFNYYVFEN